MIAFLSATALAFSIWKENASCFEKRTPWDGHCRFEGPKPGSINGVSLVVFDSLQSALDECVASDCIGVSLTAEMLDGSLCYATMGDANMCPALVPSSTGVVSYLRQCSRFDSNGAFNATSSMVKTGKTVPHPESIFVGVASYKDPLCRQTVKDAIRRAKHPERISFGVVDQLDTFETPCIPYSCDDETNILCEMVSRKQIRVHRMHFLDARGPTLARHLVEKLFANETYYLQIDAHMLFTANWDIQLIDQWRRLHDENGILTAYPTAASHSVDQFTGTSLRVTTPVMHKMRLMENMLFRFEGASEVRAGVKSRRICCWAAGLSFSKGHRITNVPYDCCTPGLFMGEEIGMAVRMFTHGYNFYSFRNSVIFHFYPDEIPRKNIELFWKSSPNMEAFESCAAHRVKMVLGWEYEESGCGSTEDIEKYGIGSKRSVEDYFWGMFQIKITRKLTKDDTMYYSKISSSLYYFHSSFTNARCHATFLVVMIFKTQVLASRIWSLPTCFAKTVPRPLASALTKSPSNLKVSK